MSDPLVPTALQVRLDSLDPQETRVPPALLVPREQPSGRSAPAENRRPVQQVPLETRVPPATLVPLGPLAQPVPPVQLEIQLMATRALREEAWRVLSATRARPAPLDPPETMTQLQVPRDHPDRMGPRDPRETLSRDMKERPGTKVQLETRSQARLDRPVLKAPLVRMGQPVRAEPLFQVIILKSRVMQRALARILTLDFQRLAPQH